jgi:hypothetical protein
MITITVSTYYDDILNIIIPQNYKFFEKWYIVTSENDEKTINIIKKYNYDNIEIVFYDFWKNNKLFNKGGAIRHCQENIIAKLNYKGTILLLDSDIYLPDNFNDIINSFEINDDTLYGTNKRHDFYSYENFKNNIVDLNYPWARFFQGYFQLYKFNDKFLYNESINCADCDLNFANIFKNKLIIESLSVSHLGKNATNWDTRKNRDDFLIESI